MNLENYTVIDIENPNKYNDSICSIGIVAVKEGKISFQKEYLINPEAEFDELNKSINGITEEKVKDAPKINEIWDTNLKKYFTNGIIIGHNVIYDINVIAKFLERNSIEVPDIYYIDTLPLARQYLPQMEKYSLDYLCKYYNLDLKKHHNALNDSLACYEILKRILNDNEINDNIIEVYNHEYGRLKSHKLSESVVSKEINTFYGIMHGIVADKIMNKKEIEEIGLWASKVDNFSLQEPFCFILPKIKEILSDKKVTEDEQKTILELLNKYTSNEIYTNTTLALQILNGILKGICCDEELNEFEINSLKSWLYDNKELSGNYPYDKILEKIEMILEDNIITEDEKLELFNIFKEFIDPISREEINDDIDFDSKVICLSGEFSFGTKSELGKKLESLGGVITGSVSKKTNYLIVGGKGSSNWAYGDYGNKVKSAIELQGRGIDIKILSEEEVIKLLGD